METAEQTSAFVSVAEFYAGKSVFVTGVTGFLGKVFLEKLLYSCKDIDNVYVLIRDKKGKNAKQRIEEVINKPIFSRLKEERPNDFNKVIPIAGDINLPGLGISTKDEEILLQKVSVVFHIAATIRFNEELKMAVNTNVTGTKCVLDLCQRIKNIKAFVHVSTAYCNTDKQILEEKVYPPPAELSEVQKFLEQSNYDREEIKALLNGAPNTYTFTKALAETYVAENHGNVPTVIIRPATVSASFKEPLAGWVDNWSGATGMLAAIMKGGIRVMLGDGGNLLDLIPVDYVANLTIVAAARCRSADNVPVYNSCTSSCNPITLCNIMKYLKGVVFNNGFDFIDFVDYARRYREVGLRRYLRDYSDSFTKYSLEEFHARYRFTPESVKSVILPLLASDLRKPTKRGLPFAPEIMLSTNNITLLRYREFSGGSRVTPIFTIFTKNKFLLSTLTFLLQTTPAYLADLFLRATGKQPIYMKIQSKLVASRDILEFFTSNSWEMKACHTRALHASLSAEDRHQFPCDPSDINWDKYFAVYIEGVKQLLLTKRV